MLGSQWSQEELIRFYEAYRKYGKDWKKVSAAVRNRSFEMVEALYSMNRAYLSLPEGTASKAGLIAMMTDHYSNLGGSDSEQESNDGAGSSRKTQKRARGKIQPTASKVADEKFVSHSQTVASNYGCLSLLKKKRTGGTRPRPVGKRTPRFPVSFSGENNTGDKYFSPTRQGLKIKANADDDEVAHEIAMALAEASQRGGSPQVSRTPSRRTESVISSPIRSGQRKHSAEEMLDAKIWGEDMGEEDLEGSTEGDTGELFKHKPSMVETGSIDTARQKGRKLIAKKFEVDENNENNLDEEECSGTEEGLRIGEIKGKFDVEVTDAKILRSSLPRQRKKSKKVLFKRDDEGAAFDALKALADLSLMLPTENEDESIMPFNDEGDDHVDESGSLEAMPANQQKEKHSSSRVRMKGCKSSLGVASSKTTKPGKVSVYNESSVPEEQDMSRVVTKCVRKKQRIQTSKIEKTDATSDMHLSESSGIEAHDVGKKLASKSKKTSQSGSPNLMKISENSGAVLRKEGSDSAQSALQDPLANQVNLATKVRSRRKMNLKKPQAQKDLKFYDKIQNDHSTLHLASVHDKADLKGKISNCLVNPRLRRWCTYEWLYSAIDSPWFAKREFVEYLYHVGLGHVPRLTRAEWGVIRSSLGRPRRFSEQFLKEEKEKLDQYRDSVRKHYTELREGVRDGLPTDLARPLSVGQRVIAIHPKTREVHDGSVLTVDHSRCRVQFDRHELGVEFVTFANDKQPRWHAAYGKLDIDCMPLYPSENMPSTLGRHTVAADKFLENFNELQINGRSKEYMKLSSSDILESIDGLVDHEIEPSQPIFRAFPTMLTSATANVQSKAGPGEIASYQQTAQYQPTVAPNQANEADIEALAELTRALDKKEGIVLELRNMNDDVLKHQKDDDISLKDSESFRKQYAAVLVQLNEANEQVSSALHCLRLRNTYQGSSPHKFTKPVPSSGDPVDRSACQHNGAGSHVIEIMDSSKTKARILVDAAMQALSSLKVKEDSVEKIEEAIDYVNDYLPSDESCMPSTPDSKVANSSNIEPQIPLELITRCIATLLMIQKCTERQSPPEDVAKILDSALTSLRPCSSQNLPIYDEIQKCMGIIKNQILALMPTVSQS
ncbi:protein ALWAYS EARLY 3-like [Dorcoceras hygrometricum]|uniref:Protein ALWAYS EARLY 3-like n=1 Tax=Dorcoceras hygrometricum TaxID=472368 RepID=A0A2Z7ARJ4_9LAMI|nr:protein ALWAYS EARLY 3-like [Dorcoceras hygrometricum]